MSEFDLINQFFRSLPQLRNDVVLGIGDDCAILEVPADKQLVVSTDTLISGVHFPQQTAAYDIGYKSLAVNLSDLAAMGAEPAWATLCITLPENDPDWLRDFVAGFSELLIKNNMQLVGGDTTRGPLSVSVHVSGFVDRGKALRRDKARPGDLIYVTDTIGDAGLGLKALLEHLDTSELDMCINKLNRPTPRIKLAKALADICHCAIDISDGLLADLGHICEESQCGAEVYLSQLPLSEELKQFYGDNVDYNQVLTSGDDYELCFTIGEQFKNQLLAIAELHHLNIACIGKITEGDHVKCFNASSEVVEITTTGYQHF